MRRLGEFFFLTLRNRSSIILEIIIVSLVQLANIETLLIIDTNIGILPQFKFEKNNIKYLIII